MNIEGLAVYVLAQELNQQLSGGRIVKIQQPTRFLFMLKIRQMDQEFALAISIDPSNPCLYLTRETRENPPEPSALCMLLRKHLLDGRIATVRQQSGFDRVVHILVDIRRGPGIIDTKTLTVELAGKNSNLILCHNDLILDAARRVGHNTSRFRQIVPGVNYAPPPFRSRLNPLFASPETMLASLMNSSGQSLAKTLVASIDGIGPAGAAEILFRAGLGGSMKPENLDSAAQTALTASLRAFFSPYQQMPAFSYVACDRSNQLLAVTTFEPHHLNAPRLLPFPTLNEALAFAVKLSAAPKTTLHQDIIRRVKSELDKLERKTGLLTQELAESQNASVFRRYADLLLGSLHLMAQGQAYLQIPDIYSGADSTDPNKLFVKIPLEPALSPMANIQRYYKKYARAKRAQESIQAQIQNCREEILYLESVALSINEPLNHQEILEVVQELDEAGYSQTNGRTRPSAKPSEPRKIILPSGAIVFIGRNNRQNDRVTFKIAQPRDLWFHTKNIPGSHVILRSPGPLHAEQDIEKAAYFAAWFSKARNSANVPIDFTERRYVKKPSGAKPGFVIYEKQKTLVLTPDHAILEKISGQTL